MKYFPQDLFHNFSSIWGNSHIEDSTDLKLPVVSRWFLSPETKQTREGPQRLPDSDGAVAFQRAAIGSIWKDKDSRDSVLYLHWAEAEETTKPGWMEEEMLFSEHFL